MCIYLYCDVCINMCNDDYKYTQRLLSVWHDDNNSGKFLGLTVKYNFTKKTIKTHAFKIIFVIVKLTLQCNILNVIIIYIIAKLLGKLTWQKKLQIKKRQKPDLGSQERAREKWWFASMMMGGDSLVRCFWKFPQCGKMLLNPIMNKTTHPPISWWCSVCGGGVALR